MGAGDKIVGVLGGMGPEATVEFLRRLIAATPARDDVDHLHVLVDNNPKVPSRIAFLVEGHGADPGPVLCQMAQGLQAQGAHFLVMPCNTAHHFLPAIAASVGIPMLDMVDLSIRRLRSVQTSSKRVGVLATPALRRVGLIESRLGQAGLQVIFPDQAREARLLEIIRAVKAQRLTLEDRSAYSDVAQHVLERGADCLLIACTELSVIGAPERTPLPYVDSLAVLVEATLATARNST